MPKPKPKPKKSRTIVDTIVNLTKAKSSANSQSTRVPHKLVNTFSYHKAFKYNKKELELFLFKACTEHCGKTLALTDQEKDDLQDLWEKILKPYLDCPRESSCSCKDKLYHGVREGGKLCCERQIRLAYDGPTKKFTLNPVRIRLHGIEIPIYSIHCALAAVLTITLVPPELSSQKAHDHAYCLATLLGKWCLVIVDGNAHYCPSMVFLMCGTSKSDLSTILWSCGVSKSIILRDLDDYQRKMGRLGKTAESLMQSWRVDRQNMVNNAIGVHFSEKELPGSQPPRSKAAVKEFLSVVAKEKKEDAEGIEKIYQERVKLPEEAPKESMWRFGDCAEAVPMTIAANIFRGYVAAIALKPENISTVLRIEKTDQVVVHNPIGPELELSCQVCQWSFAGLQYMKKIEVREQVQISDTFEMLELNVSAPQIKDSPKGDWST